MKVPLGRHIQSGQLKLVTELDQLSERGLKCQCVCVGCGSPLVARMGVKRSHYFAHYRKEDYSQSCSETAIHLLAKTIILRTKKVIFPLHIELRETYDKLYEKVISSESVFRQPVSLIDPVEEYNLPDYSFKPDVFAKFEIYDELHEVAIEVAVTHFVDDEKSLKVIDSDINMLEVNLSKLVLDTNITEQRVEEALANEQNWKWIHKSSSWVNLAKNIVEKDLRLKVEDKNNSIESWCDNLRSYYRDKGQIKLPSYIYSDMVSNPRIRSEEDRPIPVVTIPPKPNIEKILEIDSISDLVDGVLNFNIKFKNDLYSLPLRLTNNPPSQFHNTKTHLIINPQLDKLPDMGLFERVIYWGYNETAMRHEELVEEILEQEQRSYDASVWAKKSQKTREDIQLYEDYLSGRKPPISNNIEKIKTQARKYWIEMKKNDIPVDNILHDVNNSWIFGCEKVWQVFVVYCMCLDGSAHGRANEIYKQLRSEFKLYPLWPIGELSRNRATLLKLEYDLNKLIDPVEVIEEYLHQLSMVRILMPAVGRGYEKRFKCGHRFNA